MHPGLAHVGAVELRTAAQPAGLADGRTGLGASPGPAPAADTAQAGLTAQGVLTA